jgi:lipopolysaccharide/colanic/teichoic acid biosynthesis glycosyltransferase
LPQLINVIKGEMSLVGPRPDEVCALSMYSKQEAKKLEAKPGLIGLAVIKGRNKIPWQERVKYDVEYVENWSPWLDIKIILSVWKGFLCY